MDYEEISEFYMHFGYGIEKACLLTLEDIHMQRSGLYEGTKDIEVLVVPEWIEMLFVATGVYDDEF